jgi:hypothetical protein
MNKMTDEPGWLMPIILAIQEDQGSKPARTNTSQDPISKISNTKRGWWSGGRG